MPGFVLTDRATFKCSHMAAAVPMSAGITISATATRLTINGAHPILKGATIAGFTSALCPFVESGNPAPCVSFTLATPNETHLAIGGSTVFTQADLATIALIPSSGNSIPGLTITETQTLLSST